MVSWNGFEAVCGVLLESVAVTVKVEGPAAVGAPEMAPVAASSDRPAGSDPLVTAHEMGARPPAEVRVLEYARATSPSGSGDAVVMARPVKIEMLSARVAGLALASVTWTVKLELPAVDGVPESAPVVPLSAIPFGSAPAEIAQVSGALPPDACSACEYATPTVPSPSD